MTNPVDVETRKTFEKRERKSHRKLSQSICSQPPAHTADIDRCRILMRNHSRNSFLLAPQFAAICGSLKSSNFVNICCDISLFTPADIARAARPAMDTKRFKFTSSATTQVDNFIQKFPFYKNLFEDQVEVARVEGLHAHEAVLAAAGEALAIGMECQTVDGSEVSFESRELLFVDEMEEAGVEFAGAGRGGRHVHRLLSAAEHDVLKDRTDGRRVHRLLRLVSLQAIERVGVEELRGGVL